MEGENVTKLVLLVGIIYLSFYLGIWLGKSIQNFNKKVCFIDGLRQGIMVSKIISKERLSNFSFIQDNTIYIVYTDEKGLMINGKPASYYNVSSRCLP